MLVVNAIIMEAILASDLTLSLFSGMTNIKSNCNLEG
jgi:hypothetical protein